jgi:hypothetical protein
MDEMEKISEKFTNVVNIDDKSGLPSADLDVVDDDVVHVINATDTSNNKDKR